MHLFFFSKRILVVTLVAFGFACGVARADAVVVGGTCSQVGLSMMTTDQRNIVICLLNDSNKPVWKSSTASATTDYCGLAVLGGGYSTSCVNQGHGTVTCSNNYYGSAIPISIEKCQNVDISSAACPSGYTKVQSGSVYSGDGTYFSFVHCEKS